MTTELASKVTLIPWDADSEVHREWLVKQRVECSWHQDKVQTKWKIQQQKGEKCIFWIVGFDPMEQNEHQECLHPAPGPSIG
jgi:hypothetical protein